MKIHKKIQQQLFNAIERGKISHALLFSGKNGYGTLPLALWYAEKLLCRKALPNCENKVKNLQHADLHFTYPITSTDKVKKPETSSFINEWRSFVAEQAFGTSFDWMKHIDAEKKQGAINVRQAEEIIKSMNLRSYEGGYRVMIIWLPELMNAATSNKLLKLIEEPPQNAVFLLVSEDVDSLLPTVISRCQIINIPALTPTEIESTLIDYYNVEQDLAHEIAAQSQGDVNNAVELLFSKSEEFEELFISWVRNAFRAKKDLGALKDIIDWSVLLSKWSRDKQKQFLTYCADIFRQAVVKNYGAENISINKFTSEDFKWDSFSRFIHGNNIENILNEINESAYHIERNGNARIIFLDMGIKMTRFIHSKENSN